MTSIKKVAVIGATGKTGFEVVKQLKAKGYEPVGFIRDPKKGVKLTEIGVDFIVLPLEEAVSKFALEFTSGGFDAIVFAAGTKNLANFDEVVTVDLDGAIKIIEAAEHAKVKRVVFLSSINASDRDFWYSSRTSKVYYMAKRAVGLILQRSVDLDYTLIEPGPLVDGPGTGKIKIPKDAYIAALKDFNWGENYLAIKVTREDTALAIVEALENHKTIGKIIPVINGNTPIEDVLSEYLGD